jgi:transposase InsO family protein
MLQWDMLWEVTEGRVNVAELCREFGVSRKTAYKWRKRWDPADPGSLADRSRRPARHPSQTPERTEDVIVEYRKKWPSWGPKKLHTVLSRTYEVGVPSVATIGRILKRRGLIVDSRRRRSKTPRFSAPFEGCNAPNDVWCADFKGHFQTGRTRCHPLTITDGCSRAILRIEAVKRPRKAEVRTVFESAFAEFGLPKAIRTDCWLSRGRDPSFSRGFPRGSCLA